MFRKRPSLPFPPVAEGSALEAAAADEDPRLRLESLLQEREELSRRVSLLDSRISLMAFESICGATDDSQHVESYDGTLGVTVEFVRQYSPPVGQLQWARDLHERFGGPGESPGNVNGVRWGSGGLIALDLFITAGHCFDRETDWDLPQRGGVVISEAEIASLMHVNFNYQINPATGAPRAAERFPVAELLEYRRNGIDYAIVRMGRNSQGRLPGETYGTLAVAGGDLQQSNAMLCVIQHPNGSPKKIEAGPLRNRDDGRVFYNSLDTLGGSSGSPILYAATGEVIGVHTNGGCTEFSGANFGMAIGAIRQASNIL